MLLFHLALRNIFRHKGRTLVIGSILFIGALILTLGNATISGINQNFKRNIIEAFAGDIVLISNQNDNHAILMSMSAKTPEPIGHYLDYQADILGHPDVAAVLPAAIGYVWILNDSGQPLDQYVLGVDFPSYLSFFKHHITLVEGQYPSANTKAMLMSTQGRENIFDYTGYWVVPSPPSFNMAQLTEAARKEKDHLKLKKDVVFLGLSDKNTSLDIASPTTGIFKFKALNKILGYYALIDIDSFRECFGYASSQEEKKPLSTSEKALLDTISPELSFDLSTETSGASGASPQDHLVQAMKTKIPSTTLTPKNWKEGVFNLIFVKIKPSASVSKTSRSLNALFEKKHYPLLAISSKEAIGMMGEFSGVMKAILYAFVGFLFFVALMIITNTLSIAALERSTEIGMMRAIGVKKSTLTWMFMLETVMQTFVFGGAGILSGVLCTQVLALSAIQTDNEMLQLFFGGDTFHPITQFSDILISIALLFLIAVLATLYPILVARRITPLDAMARE